MQPRKPLVPRLVLGESVDLQKHSGSVKEDRSLLTCYPKFSNTIRRIVEISILIIAHVVADTPNAFNIGTLLARVPKSFISSEGLDAVDVGELKH